MLITSGQQAASGNGSNIWGDLLILTAQLSFSVYLVFFQGLIGRYSPVTIMKWMFTGASLSLLPFTWEKMLSIDWTTLEWRFLADITFVVAGGTFISYLLVSIGQKRLRSTVVSIYNYIQPLAASVMAVIWGMDFFTVMKSVAVAFIFTGVFLVTQNRGLAQAEKAVERHRQPRPPA